MNLGVSGMEFKKLQIKPRKLSLSGKVFGL